jgi:hypothetical protein
MLGNIYDLTLTYCTAITDVSALGNIYKLTLSSCNSITDISCLGNRNHYLDFRFALEQDSDGNHMLNPAFSQINNVTSLWNVNTLILVVKMSLC